MWAWDWRFESLNVAARLELLLRVWWWFRVRDVLRECDRMGGVLGTETLEKYEVRGGVLDPLFWLSSVSRGLK